jgi:hypothetical protein
MPFAVIYETLDVFLDSLSKLPSVMQNKANMRGESTRKMILKEPVECYELINVLLDEICNRVFDDEKELKDYEAYLICKCVITKPFLLDKSYPAVNTFLNLFSCLYESEIGSKIRYEQVAYFTNLVQRYNLSVSSNCQKNLAQYL